MASATPILFDLEEPGFWLTRRADIASVSTRPELFTSEQGIALDPMPAEVQRFASFFLTMDPPQHTVYRRLISSPSRRETCGGSRSRSTTPPSRSSTIWSARARSTSSPHVPRLPMPTIMNMPGVTPSEQPGVAKAAEKLFSMSDDEYSSLEKRAADTINEIMLPSSTGVELAKYRRSNPGDDLMTSIVNAELDGQRLTDEEIGSFLILLAPIGVCCNRP